jgi:ubiquinone/menaquinone biosynthesis C-methylase UbiE
MAAHERMFSIEHAGRLDNPERLVWLPPDEVLRRLAVAPGMVVADVGAGTGYFTLPLAAAVGPSGRVHAVDLQREMLDLLGPRVTDGLVVDLVRADAAETSLVDESVDLVFTANLWHELDDTGRALAEFARILRPEGRLAIVDWRVDVDQPPGPPLAHRLSATRVVGHLRERKWSEIAVEDVGQFSYLVTARRPGG